jgi:hypothetical protein
MVRRVTEEQLHREFQFKILGDRRFDEVEVEITLRLTEEEVIFYRDCMPNNDSEQREWDKVIEAFNPCDEAPTTRGKPV